MNVYLVHRITAAMDEADKLAAAAIDQMTESDYFAGDDSPTAWTLGVAGGLGGPVGDHAAFWAPDRVLALIAADRNLLDYATQLAHSGVAAAAVIAEGLVKYLVARWVAS